MKVDQFFLIVDDQRRDFSFWFHSFFATFLYENEAQGLEQAAVVIMATRVLRPLKMAFLCIPPERLTTCKIWRGVENVHFPRCLILTETCSWRVQSSLPCDLPHVTSTHVLLAQLFPKVSRYAMQCVFTWRMRNLDYRINVILSFSALTELWSQVIMAAPQGQNYGMNQGQYPPNYYPPQQPGYYQPPPQGQYAPQAYYQVGKKCWNMLSFTPSVETVLFSYITISSCKSHWVIVTGCIEYVYCYKNWT